MMKMLQILSCTLFTFHCFLLSAQSEFVVQLAAYEVKVSENYFNKLPEKAISYYKDHYGFYHYFEGKKYSSEAEAEAVLSAIKSKYPNAIVLDLQELKACNYCCNVAGTSVYEESLGYRKEEPKPKERTVIATPISFRDLYKKIAPVPPPAPEPYATVRKEVVYAPPVSNCMVPTFNPKGQEDFERIRRVAEHYPGAIVYMLPCAPEALWCYLSLRNSGFCGQQISSRQEVREVINCPEVNSCVYIVDAISKKVLDIEYEFRKIASGY